MGNRFNSSNVEPSDDAPFLGAGGMYTLKVEQCKFQPGKDGRKSYVVEFEVVESQAVEPDAIVNAPGTKAVYVNKVGRFPNALDAWDRANLEFVCGLMGYDFATEGPEIAEAIIPQVDKLLDQSIDMGKFVGLVVKCKTFQKPGKTFTNHKWIPVRRHEPTVA